MALEITTAPLSSLDSIREALAIATMKEVMPEAKYYWNGSTGSIGPVSPSTIGTILNLKPLAQCAIIALPYAGSGNPAIQSVSAIQGGEFLTDLENVGTQTALSLDGFGFSASTLNDFFTSLPITTKTVTIRVVGNPGAATCDTSIATNKGYTVVTS